MKLTFVITNDKHHQAMMWPVAQRMATRHSIHCLSFAEFRGLDTPMNAWKRLGATVTRVPPRNVRPKPQTADAIVAIGAAGGAGRGRLHAMVWHGLLHPFVRLKSPDLLILPNDTAFPSNYLVAKLKRRGIPYLLVQEGIRFALPGETAGAYGTGGGDVACWGPGSAAFFRSQGVPDSKIHVTGNPRYDDIVGQDWQAAAAKLKADGALPPRYLLFASNPIDDQGLCTTQQKYEWFRRFAEQAVPALDSMNLSLAVKLHGRDSILAFRDVLGPFENRVVFLGPGNIHAQLTGAEAVVVWASTVGLEAILHDVPIGVLDIPGHGHVFDYVDRGAAVGLDSAAALAPQIHALLKEDRPRFERARAYLEHHLSRRGRSAEAVEALIESKLQAVGNADSISSRSSRRRQADRRPRPTVLSSRR